MLRNMKWFIVLVIYYGLFYIYEPFAKNSFPREYYISLCSLTLLQMLCRLSNTLCIFYADSLHRLHNVGTQPYRICVFSMFLIVLFRIPFYPRAKAFLRKVNISCYRNTISAKWHYWTGYACHVLPNIYQNNWSKTCVAFINHFSLEMLSL